MSDEEIRHFRRRLRTLQRDLGWQWKNDASCCGIAVSECHALLEVAESEGMSLAELAAVLGLDASAVSRTVDGMVQAGLVTRTANPQDRRYVRISLTPHGRSVYENIDRTFNHYFAEVLSLVPEEKRHQVVEGFALLVDAIHKSHSRGDPREGPGHDG
ncbi:MAG: MarR family transcriptional regulator [bacterium]|nr:MarR family transcriptional regulator [bacterium]